jgi:hypothetical protein
MYGLLPERLTVKFFGVIGKAVFMVLFYTKVKKISKKAIKY